MLISGDDIKYFRFLKPDETYRVKAKLSEQIMENGSGWRHRGLSKKHSGFMVRQVLPFMILLLR